MMSIRKNYWIALKKLRRILNKRIPKKESFILYVLAN